MSLIEQARKNITEVGLRQVASEHIFETSKELLKKYGEQLPSSRDDFSIVLEHNIDAVGLPTVNVKISSDTTVLENMREVRVNIKAVRGIYVSKKEGLNRSIYHSDADLPTLDGYLATVRDVKWGLEAPKREAARLVAQEAPKPQ